MWLQRSCGIVHLLVYGVNQVAIKIYQEEVIVAVILEGDQNRMLLLVDCIVIGSWDGVRHLFVPSGIVVQCDARHLQALHPRIDTVCENCPCLFEFNDSFCNQGLLQFLTYPRAECRSRFGGSSTLTVHLQTFCQLLHAGGTYR